MANEFIIKHGYFSQGDSNVTGSVAITQNVTASGALLSSSAGPQLVVIGSGSEVVDVYGSQGNLLIIRDSMSGSLFTVNNVSGYRIFDVNSNRTATLSGSLLVTQSVAIGEFVTASKALLSSSNGNQLTVVGSGSLIAQVYGSQGNLLTINDTFSGSIFAITDVSGYPILDITSDYYTGSVFMPMMRSQSQQHVVAYDSASGLLTYVSASAIGGGGSGFPFSGSAVITGSLLVSQSGIVVTGSISATNGFTGSLLGTASYITGSIFTGTNLALSASYTLTASYFSGFNSTSSFIGDGAATTWTINHNFNTRDLHVTVYSASATYETVYPDVQRPTVNSVSLIFANPPTSLQYVVYISR
jgi:hypothetical protein